MNKLGTALSTLAMSASLTLASACSEDPTNARNVANPDVTDVKATTAKKVEDVLGATDGTNVTDGRWWAIRKHVATGIKDTLDAESRVPGCEPELQQAERSTDEKVHASINDNCLDERNEHLLSRIQKIGEDAGSDYENRGFYFKRGIEWSSTHYAKKMVNTMDSLCGAIDKMKTNGAIDPEVAAAYLGEANAALIDGLHHDDLGKISALREKVMATNIGFYIDRLAAEVDPKGQLILPPSTTDSPSTIDTLRGMEEDKVAEKLNRIYTNINAVQKHCTEPDWARGRIEKIVEE